MEKINTVTPPEQFPVTNRLPSRLLLICHTQTADTTRKPDTAARLGNAGVKGGTPFCQHNPASIPFFFIVAASRWKSLTYLKTVFNS